MESDDSPFAINVSTALWFVAKYWSLLDGVVILSTAKVIRDKGKALKWGILEALGAQISFLAAARKAGRTLTAQGCVYTQPTSVSIWLN